MRLQVCIATMDKPDDQVPDTINSLINNATTITADDFLIHYNSVERNDGVVGAYEKLYRLSTADVLMYVHNDVYVRERGWDERLLQEFTDPTVGVVGLGGAIRHGHPDLYKVPYHLPHLARSRYISNVDDAETHGERFTGSRDVAVLDGFVVAVRRSLLDRMGGWSAINGRTDRFFCYDYAMCGWARRLGYRVRVVGVRCHHTGGQTSVKVKDNPITGQQAYDESHRWFYENFRDVLPWKCD